MPFFLYICIKCYSNCRFILRFGAEIGAIYGELILEFSAFVQQIFIRQISIRIPKRSKRMPDELISCSVGDSTFFTAAVKGRSHIVNNMVRKNRFELFTDNIAVYNLKRSYPLNVWCKHRCNGYPFIFHAFVFAFGVYSNDKLSFDFSRIIFVRTKPSIKGECEYGLVFCICLA